jgi:hypothetical protein
MDESRRCGFPLLLVRLLFQNLGDDAVRRRCAALRMLRQQEQFLHGGLIYFFGLEDSFPVPHVPLQRLPFLHVVRRSAFRFNRGRRGRRRRRRQADGSRGSGVGFRGRGSQTRRRSLRLRIAAAAWKWRGRRTRPRRRTRLPRRRCGVLIQVCRLSLIDYHYIIDYRETGTKINRIFVGYRLSYLLEIYHENEYI